MKATRRAARDRKRLEMGSAYNSSDEEHKQDSEEEEESDEYDSEYGEEPESEEFLDSESE